jgi:hypothetical protein
VAPGAAGRRGLRNSGEAGAVPGRGKDGEGSLGSRAWFGCLDGVEVALVGCSAAAAGAVRLFPARPAPDRGRARQGQLQEG